jgi:septal ring factor EnvC (AmiA/AmiB activator)
MAAVVVALAAAPPVALAAADAPDVRLERVEKQLEQSRDRERTLGQKAERLAADVTRIKRDLVDAAAAAQDTEEKLSALEARLGDLRTREARLRDELGARRDQMIHVLTALERLALRPPQAVMVQPVPAADVVRSAILLRAALPRLQDRADSLRDDLTALARVRLDIDRQRGEIAAAAERLQEQTARLDHLFTEKARLQEHAETERKAVATKAAALARDAKSLRDLLARLEAERKRREAEQAEQARRLAALAMAKPTAPRQTAGPGVLPRPKPSPTATGPAAAGSSAVAAALPPPRALEDMRGAMPMPARGRLIARYGEPTDLGGASKGIVIETRPAAQVVAPGDGTVAFAGPFRGYGLLLIIEHGGGYHVLLSGMSRIDAVVGQRLLSGEPVGVMAPTGGPALYVELRRDGQPINPLPWLTARKG